ncbi:flagellar motor component [Thiorhodovibrio frisius]|uniref:Flagellar motor component n=2 Tax=Thiorhodovibrio frisius TaxID=631362 RepID=H8Z3G7_9GAMM|nr:flagellar motor component [Thiorhodovibrio frisius]WPL24164.1 Chemotaxis protein PomA [Thiorhodovibrio frisius]
MQRIWIANRAGQGASAGTSFRVSPPAAVFCVEYRGFSHSRTGILPMDFATIVGVVVVLIAAIGAILVGGDIGVFINIPSILIVVLGTFGATLVRISFGEFFGSFKIGLKSIIHSSPSPRELIEDAVQLANVARKEGILALENQTISEPFMQKGISLCIDGHPPETVERLLSKEIDLTIERHTKGVKMWASIGDYSPAFGMIGTLIGLVQMLSNMDDPKAIGPAMAVALLTTLYGALIANGFAIPISEKLKAVSEEERMLKDLVLEAISAIQSGINPRVMEQILLTYLPSNQRDSTLD